MGRATEFFDYINVDPKDLNERKQLYCSLAITDELKKIRREYLRLKRKRDK